MIVQRIADNRVRVALERTLATFAERPAGLFTDFDGTISPIVPTPEQARADPASIEALRQLSHKLALVAIVSGRSAADVHERVGLPGVVYVGNHGLEMWHDGVVTCVPGAERFPALLRDALERLQARLTQRGLRFEHKGLTASIHYRQADDPDAGRRAILAAIANEGLDSILRVSEGRMVVELRPPIAVNKGTAVRQLVDQFGLRSAVFVGDDRTDVDAFRALRELVASGQLRRALAIGVAGAETPPEVVESADVMVTGTSEVATYLTALARAVANDLREA